MTIQIGAERFVIRAMGIRANLAEYRDRQTAIDHLTTPIDKDEYIMGQWFNGENWIDMPITRLSSVDANALATTQRGR